MKEKAGVMKPPKTPNTNIYVYTQIHIIIHMHTLTHTQMRRHMQT